MSGSLELALDEREVEVEEVQALGVAPPLEHLVEESPQRRAGDRSTAESRHDVVHLHREAPSCVAGVLADDAAGPDRERLLHDDHPLRVAQRLAHLIDGPRAEAGDAQRTDRDTFTTQAVDDLLDRAEHRTEG